MPHAIPRRPILLALLALLGACRPPARPAHAVRARAPRIALAQSPTAALGVYARIQVNETMGSVVSAMDNSLNNRAEAFTRAVNKAWPGHDVYGVFLDELAAALRARGFQVVDLRRREEGAEITDPRGQVHHLPRVGPEEADALLLPEVSFGYAAPSALQAYARQGSGAFLLVDLKEARVLVQEPVAWRAPDSTHEYYTLDRLLADAVPATEALRAVARDLARTIASRLE